MRRGLLNSNGHLDASSKKIKRLLTGRTYLSCPSQTVKAPIMAPVTAAVSPVAWDVMASSGRVINQCKTSRYA